METRPLQQVHPGSRPLIGLLQLKQQVQAAIAALAVVANYTVIAATIPYEGDAVRTLHFVWQRRADVQAQCRAALQAECGKLALALHTLGNWTEQGVAYVIELYLGVGRTAGHFHGRRALAIG